MNNANTIILEGQKNPVFAFSRPGTCFRANEKEPHNHAAPECFILVGAARFELTASCTRNTMFLSLAYVRNIRFLLFNTVKLVKSKNCSQKKQGENKSDVWK